MNTIGKNTHQLQTGDVIQHYGATLKLTERREYPNDKQPDNVTVQFDTECLALADNATMPEHWAYRPGGYTVQGNRYAHWAVVV